ncbi:hypothetical protein FH972_025748 [Carpinus fangiana]|uniref:C3H1-type domain-containing protein n=1 Tax=Carpinus fangiana TaxID=176857 RepID=A0A5N6L1X0_9ROSI|nr:hypothetical protein FH972_025748 [Carpinus fangiana]
MTPIPDLCTPNDTWSIPDILERITRPAHEPVLIYCIRNEDGSFIPMVPAHDMAFDRIGSATQRQLNAQARQNVAHSVENDQIPSENWDPATRSRSLKSFNVAPSVNCFHSKPLEKLNISGHRNRSNDNGSNCNKAPAHDLLEKCGPSKTQVLSKDPGIISVARDAPALETKAVASASSTPYSRGEAISWRRPPPSGIEPDLSKKVYCSHWIWKGECAYGQQGCLYKHEMPNKETLATIGIHHIPKWWQELQMFNKDNNKPQNKGHMPFKSNGTKTPRKPVLETSKHAGSVDHGQKRKFPYRNKQNTGIAPHPRSMMESKHAPQDQPNVLSRRSSTDSNLLISEYPSLPPSNKTCEMNITSRSDSGFSRTNTSTETKSKVSSLEGAEFTLEELIASNVPAGPGTKVEELGHSSVNLARAGHILVPRCDLERPLSPSQVHTKRFVDQSHHEPSSHSCGSAPGREKTRPKANRRPYAKYIKNAADGLHDALQASQVATCNTGAKQKRKARVGKADTTVPVAGEPNTGSMSSYSGEALYSGDCSIGFLNRGHD